MACLVECQGREAGMSHRGVEIVLGRLATDEATRRRFRQAPALALQELMAQGIELSTVEMAALQSLDAAAVRLFACALDPRLQKAELVVPALGEEADTPNE
jgi:hypothetical protein